MSIIYIIFVLLGVGLVLRFSKGGLSRLPKWLLFLIEGIVLIGCLVFVVVEAAIIIWAGRPCTDAQCLIILGAKVTCGRPSLSLKYRLDAALSYLEAHPECTMVIVSGGQGSDEDITEAQCMYEYLTAAGISPDMIRQENMSTSTVENLKYSMELVDVENTNILIVTNDFHIFRSQRAAVKLGYKHVTALAAKSPWYLVPTNYTREFLAVCKDFLIGNL